MFGNKLFGLAVVVLAVVAAGAGLLALYDVLADQSPRLTEEDRALAVVELEKLHSADVEEYLAARRRLLAIGPGCRPLLAAAARKLPADSPVQARFVELRNQFDDQLEAEKVFRLVAAAEQRLAEVRTERGDQASLAVLVSRSVTQHGLAGKGNHDPRGMCYFSFPKASHGNEGAVSLLFGNGSDSFQVNCYGGQSNRIVDLGPVDYASVKTAPAQLEGDRPVNAVPGHVYIEHCQEQAAAIDLTFKFRVVELKRGDWVIIEWEPIPRGK